MNWPVHQNSKGLNQLNNTIHTFIKQVNEGQNQGALFPPVGFSDEFRFYTLLQWTLSTSTMWWFSLIFSPRWHFYYKQIEILILIKLSICGWTSSRTSSDRQCVPHMHHSCTGGVLCMMTPPPPVSPVLPSCSDHRIDILLSLLREGKKRQMCPELRT